MKIPFFDLKRQYDLIGKEVEEAVIITLRGGAYVEGQAVSDFESKMSDYLGVKHVISCGNGTDAIRLALQTAGVGPGDEVLTSPFSFYATAEAVTELGAVPVFVDVVHEGYNMNPDLLEKCISSKTKAILPVHIFGLPAEMDEINEVAKKHGLAVIEDACQAIGAVYKSKKTGTLGDMGCFSFYPTKNLGGFGDGGMITTDNDDYAVILRALKAHGSGIRGRDARHLLYGDEIGEMSLLNSDISYDPYKYYNYLSGWNSRLDSVQAAVLNLKLSYLDRWNERRCEIAKRYNSAFNSLEGVSLPVISDSDRTSCCHQYAFFTKYPREEVQACFRDNGIGTGNFYPVALHQQAVFKNTCIEKMNCPVAESLCKKTVCLPVFPELVDEEVDEIVRVCQSFFGERS